MKPNFSDTTLEDMLEYRCPINDDDDPCPDDCLFFMDDHCILIEIQDFISKATFEADQCQPVPPLSGKLALFTKEEVDGMKSGRLKLVEKADGNARYVELIENQQINK